MKNVLALFAIATMTAFAHAQDTTTTQKTETEKPKAGLFFEPGIIYQSQDTKVDWGSAVDKSTGKNNGFGANLRLGMHINEIFFAGVDGRYLMTKFEDSAVNTDANAKSYDLAPMIGFQMPDIGLRLWGSYVVWGELDPEKVTSTLINYDAKLSKANGYRVGAGFHVYSFSINLEYQDLKYDTVDVDVLPANFNPNSATSKGLVFGVSFPIEL